MSEICRMKIALCHHRLMRKGGLETRLLNYLDYFINRGHEVTIYCYKQDETLSLPEGTRVKKLSVGLSPKPWRRFAFNLQLEKHFRQQEYDFSLSLERTAQQHACICPGDHKGFLNSIKRPPYKMNDWAHLLLDKSAFRHTPLLLPCSLLVADNLIHYYHVPPEKLEVLRPPLNLRQFRVYDEKERAEFKRKFNIEGGKKSFAFVSASHQRKGLPLLIQAFEKLKEENVELLIAGSPVRQKLPENCRYIGYVSDTAGLFNAVDFSVHPSLFEPFGQVISESLACGSPVLISDRCGWSPDLKPEHGKVLSHLNTEEWVESIRTVQPGDFAIERSFGEDSGLSLDAHMELMNRAFNRIYQADIKF